MYIQTYIENVIMYHICKHYVCTILAAFPLHCWQSVHPYRLDVPVVYPVG